MRRPFAGIARPVVVLGVVSFLADLSSEMAYPLVPLFLTGALGAPGLAVGVVEGVAEGTANLTKLLSGRWSDAAARRRPFVVAGYGLAALGKGVVAAAWVWPVALAGRTVDRFGKGIRSAPRDAMLADFAGPVNRGAAFGLHRAMDSLGAVCGPLLALALLAVLGGAIRPVLVVAIVPGLLAVAALRLVPERTAAEVHITEAPRASLRRLPRRFYLLLGVSMVFMAGNSSDAFLILRAKDVGLGTTTVVLAYVAYNAVYAGLSYPVGALSDRIPRERLVAGGYGVFAAVYAGFALAGSGWAVWPLFVVYGAYIALTDGVSKALVADMAPGALRSSAMGLYQGLTGLAALVASVAAGLLWDQVGTGAPFVLGAACGLLAAGLLAILSASGALRAPAPAA